jgi:Carboxypeptidase regulatory-like domain
MPWAGAIKYLTTCGFMFLAPLLLAQGPTTGSINGVVSDVSGAILADAKVTVSSPSLVVQQSTLTSAQGVYRFPAPPPGLYQVMIEAPGFQPSRRDGVTLTAGFTGTVDVSLAFFAR